MAWQTWCPSAPARRGVSCGSAGLLAGLRSFSPDLHAANELNTLHDNTGTTGFAYDATGGDAVKIEAPGQYERMLPGPLRAGPGALARSARFWQAVCLIGGGCAGCSPRRERTASRCFSPSSRPCWY